MTDLMDDTSIFCELDSNDPGRFKFISNEKDLCKILHHVVTYKKNYCLYAVGNTKLLMSCMRMNFVLELTEAYQKTLTFLYTSVLESFYAGASARKDLSGTEEFMSSVEHAVDVNKALIVDMKTLQFNYKVFRVATKDE